MRSCDARCVGRRGVSPMRVFFATDIHGSEICWRKFLNAASFYKADAVILGGDVTGKVMVPITEHNGYWQVVRGGETVRLDTREELAEAERQIRNRGSYPAVMPPDELTELAREEGAVDRRFSVEMIASLDRWLDMADGKLKGGEIPCLLNGGNDDIWEIDDVIEASPNVTFGEGKLIDLGGFHLVSMGWTNPTPWDTFREAPEEELASKIDKVANLVPDMERAIYATLRPIHGGAVMKPVGSTAVRDAIVRYQPMLSVHGHIHESRGIKKMGRTLAINPGSVYGDGVLQGALLELDAKKGKVSKYLLVNG